MFSLCPQVSHIILTDRCSGGSLFSFVRQDVIWVADFKTGRKSVSKSYDAFVLSNVCILKWFAPPEKSVTLGYFVREKKGSP